MCGIVGYVGDKDVIPVLMSGLSKLEYRGYDSAGIAYLDGGEMQIVKAQGKLSNLEELLKGKAAPKTIGIGHTRWATHGEPNFVNSHPHTNMFGDIAIVHNGIIENYMEIKTWLHKKGVVFSSDTDTEVVAHLINFFYEGNMLLAVQKAVNMIKGSYALGVISQQEQGEIIAVKKDSPLVVGLGKNENLIASDIPAILEYTRDVYFLKDTEIAHITQENVQIYDSFLNKIEVEPFTVDWDIAQAEKGGYPHFMIKEIEEQPRAIADTLNSRISEEGITFEELNIDNKVFENIKKITIIACGTAYHASYVGKYIVERFARVPVDVEIASEFRYKNPIINSDDFVIVLSQSGETADTIAALREAKEAGAYVMAVTNVVGSTVAREANGVFYTRAGLEIAVASTKAYTTQLVSMYLFALKLSYVKGTITKEDYFKYIEELKQIPKKVGDMLNKKNELQKFALHHFSENSVFYIGRGLDYALSMEGSLKLKEISYIHSEAYAAGELKHGTIALIEKDTLVVAVLTQGELLEKSISNVKEVIARGATVLAITQEKFVDKVKEFADKIITIPDTIDFMSTITSIVPMQIFAYYMSVEKGCDVDKPRNLAKSVTVE